MARSTFWIQSRARVGMQRAAQIRCRSRLSGSGEIYGDHGIVLASSDPILLYQQSLLHTLTTEELGPLD